MDSFKGADLESHRVIVSVFNWNFVFELEPIVGSEIAHYQLIVHFCP